LRITKEEAATAKQEVTKVLVRGLRTKSRIRLGGFVARPNCWPGTCRSNHFSFDYTDVDH